MSVSRDQEGISNRTRAIVSDFGKALASGNIDDVLQWFAEECYWRDLVSFTWNIKTLEGKAQIRDMLAQNLHQISPANVQMDEGYPIEQGDGFAEAWFHFETRVGKGYGHMRLVDGKVWTLMTSLQALKEYEESTGFNRPQGASHGQNQDGLTWKESRQIEAETLGYSEQPYVLVIGGGQGGIALGARLRQLGVPTIIIDRHPRAGDAWRNRYRTLCLHDPVWFDHLPYIPFPANWPVFSPKDKLGDWLEMYTQVMELNYWASTEARAARYDESNDEWVVTVERNGETVELRPKHLVLATGMSGKPNIPNFPGQQRFCGEQQHSSQHPGPDAWRGKKVVIVGANNSAHDIAAALCEHDAAEVTMIQRSSTLVVRSKTLMDFALKPLYSEEAVEKGITTERADLIMAAMPFKISPRFQVPLYEKIKEHDKAFYSALEDAGFWLDFGEDGSGLHIKYMRRGSGYYIDVGACQLVIDGAIQLEHGEIAEIVEDGIMMESGKKLEADLIVYATGYGSMNAWAADLINQEVADRVGKVWGMGSNTAKDPGPWEGELRNMWKPTQQEALWFHGGNLQQSRHYSQFLSLQLKARYEGLPTPVYGLQEVHHLS